MGKRFFLSLALFLCVFLAGCGSNAAKPDIVAKINNYEITREEFELEFAMSPFSRQQTPEARLDFLQQLVSKRLILMYAENMGFDKQKIFLRSVQNFWEQALLQMALEDKNKDIARSIAIIDREIEDEYQKMLAEGRGENQTYDQAYRQIKWLLTQKKETETMNAWLVSLARNAKITLYGDVLNGTLDKQ